MKLEACGLEFSFGEKKIISSCTLFLEPGKLTFITGPNGSGKSTLIHLLGGLFAPENGKVLLDGEDLSLISHIRRACRMGVLAQEKMPALDFSAAERIMMGRFAHLPRLVDPGKEDHETVRRVMERLGISELSRKRCNQLSGGEYQKVLIASLLARKTPVMLLDEPTSALDPASALRIMEVLREEKNECAVAVVSHDLTLAASFADELILFNEGKIFASGPPCEVLTAENIAAVYKCEADILYSASRPVVVFR